MLPALHGLKAVHWFISCIKDHAEVGIRYLGYEHDNYLGNVAVAFKPMQAVAAAPPGPSKSQSINQSKRKTSNANGQTNLGHKHKAPDHNHEATQPMVDLPHTS